VAKLKQSEGEGGKLPAADSAPAGMTATGAARRRFAKAGAGASAGVIMTLASQPGMAQTLCTSPSGMLSGNLSRHSDHLIPCAGLSPGFWKTHPEAWPGALTNPDAKFSATFSTTGNRSSALSAYTCSQIVDPKEVANGADPDNVAMHIMATLLNVRSKRIGFLTENQVLGIWNSYASTGTYQPTVGVTWNGWHIVDYLQRTMA
jgi:hypothetical protein